MTLRILLADDHRIFREALRGLLEKTSSVSVVGETGNGNEVLAMVREHFPDIVCMDIGMPGLNGIQVTRQLHAMFPQIKVIALSTHAEPVYVMDMLRAGALAYVAKDEGGRELLRAIEAVAMNRQYLCPLIAATVDRATVNRESGKTASRLGERELQVLRLVAQGMNSQEIAARLAIATGTVDVHRRNIMRKLNLHSAVELTRYAIATGLVSD